jgi:hypothetical protein
VALEERPDHYGAVIILHDVEGLSMAEVADCVNITVPTARLVRTGPAASCASVSQSSWPAHRQASRCLLKAKNPAQRRR